MIDTALTGTLDLMIRPPTLEIDYPMWPESPASSVP